MIAFDPDKAGEPPHNMSDKDTGSKITLSRRKALAGIGTIGTASALGLGGTYAQFSDTETESVTFTAGGIDGTLSWSGSYNGEDVESHLDNVTTDTEGSDVGGTVHFSDIKPGDYGSVNFEIEVQNNPAWVASCLDISDNIDHANFEPEIAADGNVTAVNVNGDGGLSGDPATTDGELAQHLLTLPYYDSDGNSQFFDSNGMNTGNLPSDFAVPSEFWSNSEGPNAEDHLAPKTLKNAAESDGSLNTKEWNGGEPMSIDAPAGASVGDGCVFLDGGQATQGSSDNSRGVSELKPGDKLYFGYDFHLPFETGNVIQGDQVDIHFGFNFLQVRHTENPEFGSYSPGSNTPNGS